MRMISIPYAEYSMSGYTANDVNSIVADNTDTVGRRVFIDNIDMDDYSIGISAPPVIKETCGHSETCLSLVKLKDGQLYTDMVFKDVIVVMPAPVLVLGAEEHAIKYRYLEIGILPSKLGIIYDTMATKYKIQSHKSKSDGGMYWTKVLCVDSSIRNIYEYNVTNGIETKSISTGSFFNLFKASQTKKIRAIVSLRISLGCLGMHSRRSMIQGEATHDYVFRLQHMRVTCSI